MALPILSGSTDAAAVRLLVDQSLTVAELQDATIYSPVFYGAVQAEIVRRVPGIGDVDSASDEQAAYKIVAMYWTAAALLSGQVGLTGEKFTDEYSYTQDSGAVANRIAWLRARGEDALEPYDEATGIGTMFARVPGGRGRI
jgi:hypothetical protein